MELKRKDLNVHLFGPGPTRILSLGGGGIRGMLTVQPPKRIEKLVRDRTDDDSAVLADYFDPIGGNSPRASRCWTICVTTSSLTMPRSKTS